MKRRDIFRFAAAGGAMALLQRALAAGEAPGAPGLRRVSGGVSINGKPADIGTLVRPGDTVATAAGAEAVYVVGQDAFLQREASTVRFGAAGAAEFMRIVTGRLLSVFGRGDKQLAVSTATIGIRGTACYIEDVAAMTYFCLCYGEADVVPAAAPQQRKTLRTLHHDYPIYIHADPAMTTSMVPATVENHRDAELILLESLVGRLPPFYNTPGFTAY